VNEPAGIGAGAGKFLGVQRIFCQKNVLASSFPLNFSVDVGTYFFLYFDFSF